MQTPNSKSQDAFLHLAEIVGDVDVLYEAIARTETEEEERAAQGDKVPLSPQERIERILVIAAGLVVGTPAV